MPIIWVIDYSFFKPLHANVNKERGNVLKPIKNACFNRT